MLKHYTSLKQMLENVEKQFEAQIASDFQQSQCKNKLLNEQKKALGLESVIEEGEKVKQEIVHHSFLKVFESFVCKELLPTSTSIELFSKNKQEYLPSELIEIQILDKHVEQNEKNLHNVQAEQKLISLVQDLAHNEAQKDPIFCPLIYLQDEKTGGLVGIRIKNAYYDGI